MNIDQHITSYGALGLGFVMKENAYLLAMLDFLDKDADLVSALAESRPAFVPRGIADKVGLGGRVKVSIPITPKKSDIQAYLNLYGQMVWAEGSEDKNHVGKIGFNVEAFLGKIHQVSLRLGLEKCTGIHDSVVGNVGLAYSFYQRPWYETKYN